MKTFEQVWQASYFPDAPFAKSGSLVLCTNPALDKDESLVLLTLRDNVTRVCLTPELALSLRIEEQNISDVQTLKDWLATKNVRLHSPDLVYFGDSLLSGLQQNPDICIRRLDDKDAAAFSAFCDEIDEDELDNAYVELDHWAVYGLFVREHLVCAASLYPWEDSKLLDLGVVTHPGVRSQGLARALVAEIDTQMRQQGYVLQYRTQADNSASIRLAESLGLRFYGVWEPLAQE